MLSLLDRLNFDFFCYAQLHYYYTSSVIVVVVDQLHSILDDLSVRVHACSRSFCRLHLIELITQFHDSVDFSAFFSFYCSHFPSLAVSLSVLSLCLYRHLLPSFHTSIALNIFVTLFGGTFSFSFPFD